MPRLTNERAQSVYDEDFFAWTREVAEALRSGNIDPGDVEHVAEEIEDMGKRDRRELLFRLKVLLIHLIKWEIQPSRRSPSWLASIEEQRSQIDLVLQDSPSLVREAADRLNEVWVSAQRAASQETGVAIEISSECPVPIGVILDPAFLPPMHGISLNLRTVRPGVRGSLGKLRRPKA
jgi:hypothetical protein